MARARLPLPRRRSILRWLCVAAVVLWPFVVFTHSTQSWVIPASVLLYLGVLPALRSGAVLPSVYGSLVSATLLLFQCQLVWWSAWPLLWWFSGASVLGVLVGIAADATAVPRRTDENHRRNSVYRAGPEGRRSEPRSSFHPGPCTFVCLAFAVQLSAFLAYFAFDSVPIDIPGLLMLLLLPGAIPGGILAMITDSQVVGGVAFIFGLAIGYGIVGQIADSLLRSRRRERQKQGPARQ